MMTEIIYRLALAKIDEIGAVLARNLVEYFGSAEAIFKLNKSDWEELPVSGKQHLEVLINPGSHQKLLDDAQKEQDFIQQKKIELLFFDDPEYPRHLKNCPDAPFLLFKKGKANINPSKSVAIVGARKATAYGKEFTYELVKELAKHQGTIVSGLAYGIDCFAHQASLEYNTPTLAVLGHGLDTIYPSTHREMAIDILNSGAIISEYFSGMPALPHHFPRRNRIVAGMVDAVIIVEAAIKGGAMVTAHISHSYQKEVFAVPGRSSDKYSQGCNYLIKSQKAILLDDPQDLVRELGWEDTSKDKKQNQKQNSAPINLSENERKIWKILSEKGSLFREEIAQQVDFSTQELSNLLFEMELNGYLRYQPGNKFEWTA